MDENFSAGRYTRQTILPEIGATGQERLTRARVLVIGAGALGTPALYYLAAAGVGTLGIADDDALELSNLHRQILYRTADIGRSKAEAAAERLTDFNPDIRIETHTRRVDASNATALIRGYDMVLDATDRLETKFLVNDACAQAARPLVHAAVLGFEARVAIFDATSGPCLRCLFPAPPASPALTCSEAGVLGAVTGMAGSLQALEAIKLIIATGGANPLRTLLGRLWLLDGRTLETRVVELPRDPACPVCKQPQESISLAPEPVTVARVEPSELDLQGDALLIDVREDNEWAQGHLPDAVHYPLSRLVETVPELPAHERYIVYCAHGLRSETAARLFTTAGYLDVYSLKGGLAAVAGDKTARQSSG
ncbi:MAG: ThiF family adenylyltransferase [Gammaproteobacteria bacterium]